jgi:hypothetical protein
MDDIITTWTGFRGTHSQDQGEVRGSSNALRTPSTFELNQTSLTRLRNRAALLPRGVKFTSHRKRWSNNDLNVFHNQVTLAQHCGQQKLHQMQQELDHASIQQALIRSQIELDHTQHELNSTRDDFKVAQEQAEAFRRRASPAIVQNEMRRSRARAPWPIILY